MDGHRRTPILIPALVVAILLAQGIPGVPGLLEYRADAVADGEWWRLLTWHGVHWSQRHLLWDLLAFGVLGSLCEARSRRLTVSALVVGVLTVSVAVRVVRPELQTCRGLSGIDCALFALFWWLSIREALGAGDRRQVVLFVLVGLGFAGKTIYECAVGQAFFAGDGFIPLPSSHLAGFAAGLTVAIGAELWSSLPCWRAREVTAMVQ